MSDREVTGNSVLQRVAACSVCSSVLIMRCRMLQCVALCCSVSQCVAVCCSVLQCVAVCCSVLQCDGDLEDMGDGDERECARGKEIEVDTHTHIRRRGSVGC